MAGSGFTRRYQAYPGTTVITQVPGIIIIDLPPPGSIAGVNEGVVCLVGEFVDSTYGVSVDNNGNVTQNPQPVEIFSGQDLINKVGGFDPTIGDFGNSMGNGFVELRNKTFAQLVVLPIPLASPRATRSYRKLPFNASATNPAPIVPMQGAQVPAGVQFQSGQNLVNTAGPVQFTGNLPYASGVDGAVVASVGATEQFNSLSGNFKTLANPNGSVGVALGDLLVLGAPLISAIVASTTGAGYIGANDAVVFLAAPGFTGYPTNGGLLQFPDTGELATYSGVTSSATGSSFVGLTRGVLNTAGATHAVGTIAVGLNNCDTYRVNSVPGATQMLLERQSLESFTSQVSFGATAVPWRLHTASDGESGVGIGALAGAYTVPARCLGPSGVAAGVKMTPVAPPPSITYNTWNPLSGLASLTDPTTGLAYNAAVQAANAPASASFDALYANALALMASSQNEPAADVVIQWAARKSAIIRSSVRSSVDQESAIGLGRVGVVAPDLQSVTGTSQAVAATDPGVGANRDERLIYTWPAVQTFVPEAVNIAIKGADGRFYTNGIIDMPTDGWLAAVLSNINPEWNPGQAGPPVPTVLAPISGLARNMPQNLGINDYIALEQNGVCAIKIDRTVGPVFVQGVTTSLVPGQTTIQRRRMADYIEDSIAEALAPLAKLPATLLFQDNVVTEIDGFLDGLVSPDNPAQQRINAYSVDDKSGNTLALSAQGVFVVIVNVQLTPTADFIVLQFNIGNGVVISQQNA